MTSPRQYQPLERSVTNLLHFTGKSDRSLSCTALGEKESSQTMSNTCAHMCQGFPPFVCHRAIHTSAGLPRTPLSPF